MSKKPSRKLIISTSIMVACGLLFIFLSTIVFLNYFDFWKLRNLTEIALISIYFLGILAIIFGALSIIRLLRPEGEKDSSGFRIFDIAVGVVILMFLIFVILALTRG